MAISAISPELVPLDDARRYLNDNGLESRGNADNLQAIINGATGWVYHWTGRRRLIDDGSVISEFHDGDGTNEITVDEWPITDVSAVVLYPFDATLTTTITGPGSSASNDDMLVFADEARIVLRNYTTPEVPMGVRVDYKAGYATTSPEIAAIRAVVLELVMQKWMRYRNKDTHIQSRNSENASVTFKTDEDIDAAVIRQLRQFRRLH